jgi:hypothetical protein
VIAAYACKQSATILSELENMYCAVCKKPNFSQQRWRPNMMAFALIVCSSIVVVSAASEKSVLPAGYQQQAEVNCFRLLITVQIELGVSSKLPITRLGKYLAAARETADRSSCSCEIDQGKNTKS